MYTNHSLIDVSQLCKQKSISVLDKLPQINGPQLVTSLIRPLVSLINSNLSVNDESLQCLQDDRDVLWIMEVIGYGLSLPFYDKEQIDAVRDCVNIYYEWFHALSPTVSANKFIPLPIRQDPNLYCQKIIGHLYNIFRPRTFNTNDNINDLSSKQALFCHRILRLIINIATDKDNVINSTTWECLLVFLLGINDELLKSQNHREDIGTQIAERVISTLFEGWLLACVSCFPSPSYWKTFQDICTNLRHRPALITQWNRVNVCLTNALVRLLYNTEDSLNLSKLPHFSQYYNIVLLLSGDALKQCWYRFLHIIGNPIELCFPEIIFKVDAPSQQIDNSTLNLLPFIFHKAIKGLCVLVDIFLGIPSINLDELDYEIPKFSHSVAQVSNNITPPEKRRSNFNLLNKQEKQNSIKINSNRNSRLSDQFNFSLPTFVLHSLPGNVFYKNQVKSTSVLDIFGKWLFQASLISSSNSAVLNVFQDTLTDREISIHSLKKNQSKNEKFSQDIFNLSLDFFEAGQAEAIGALCRIFCFKKSDEDISYILSKQVHPDFQKIKHYLTSYYLALKFGLSSTNEIFKIQLLSSILVNSVWFFEVDLPGSKILIPHFLKSIEIFLTKRDKSNSSTEEILIRRACIKILISLLSYPLHFRDLPIKDTLSELPSNTFLSLFPRLILLLIHGLHSEPDPVNIQMILGALLFIVEDSVKYDDLLNENLNEGANDDLVSNLLVYFKMDYQNGYESGNDFEKSELPCNMFLLIISFVAEILCKSSTNKQSYDYNVSLAALEVLCSMGHAHYKQQFLCNNKCKMCIKQIFTFIENQCYKPAMFHSKDMHSTIVAAYQCLSIWIHEHFHLLKDKECIVLLFELIELGISGSKSKKENITYKSDKILKPTSMRVKEAAEFLLSTLMGRINGVSPFSDSTILSCDLNEPKIIEHMLNLKPSQFPTNHFRYFITENSLLISILERSLLNEETICIIRSPYGKYCWLLKYQHISNKHLLNSQNDVAIYRSLPKADQHIKNVPISYFPEFFDKICSSKFDNMVLKLTDYIRDMSEIKQEYDIMQNLIDKIENNLKFEKTKLTLNTSKKEFNEPLPSKTFEASRLILSQFKVFNFEVHEENNHGLMALNENSNDFIDYLEKLDIISTKNNDLVIICYIPKGFSDESEIFQANLQQYKTNSVFKEFMSSLGNAIDCSTTSSNANILYWSDISHELMFISPTVGNSKQLSFLDLVNEDNEHLRRKLLQANQTENCSNHRIKSYLMNNIGCDIKLLVLWLESIEDFNKLPFNILENQLPNGEQESSREKLYIIIINPLRNGLFKVIPHSFGGKSTSISPTIDRMLLSKHLLAPYVRMTALNLFRRRRMNTESFQLPHVKRRLKIQEITSKFKTPYSNKELISDLFTNKSFM